MQEFKQKENKFSRTNKIKKQTRTHTHSPTLTTKLTHTLEQKHAADLTENDHEILRTAAKLKFSFQAATTTKNVCPFFR